MGYGVEKGVEFGSLSNQPSPLLELDGGHGDWPRFGDPSGLDAGNDSHAVFHRHLVQDGAARVVVEPPLSGVIEEYK